MRTVADKKLSDEERRLLDKWRAAIKVATPKQKEKMLTIAETLLLMHEFQDNPDEPATA